MLLLGVKEKIRKSEKIDEMWKLINNIANEEGKQADNDENVGSFYDTFALFDEDGDMNSHEASRTTQDLDGLKSEDEIE